MSKKIPHCYIIIHNVAKKHNVGTISRSASIFNVNEIILVGSLKKVQFFGSQGAHKYLSFRHFHHLNDAVQYLKIEKQCQIVGVEIMPNAYPVHHHPFHGNTAFIFGNEGFGLSQQDINICDYFVYIPQYGTGSASLNVSVSAGIVLHNFAIWSGYTENIREGNKYITDPVPNFHSNHHPLSLNSFNDSSILDSEYIDHYQPDLFNED